MPLQTALFAAGIVGVLAALAAVVLLRRSLHGYERRTRNSQDEIRAAMAAIAGRLADAERRLSEVEQAAGLLVEPQPPRSGLNFSKRSEAVRRFRSGQSAEKVAADLALPAAEAELLHKVCRWQSGADDRLSSSAT